MIRTQTHSILISKGTIYWSRDGEEADELALNQLKDMILTGEKMIFWDAKDVFNYLTQSRIALPTNFSCVSTMAYLLDEYEPDLDEWIKYYYEESAPDELHQVCYLWHLGRDLLSEIEQEGLLEAYKIDLKLASIISKMETQGIRIDQKGLETELSEEKLKLNSLQAKIHEALGCNVNANSPLQLLNSLREDLALPIKSTQEQELRKYREYHEIIPTILEYRKLSKLYSTFLFGMYQDLKRGRVRTAIGAVNTVTGRLTSSERNLQAVPSSAKRFFIPDAGKVFIYADYSQLELNLLANLSQDSNMIKAVNSGEDLHKSIASAIFCRDSKTLLWGRFAIQTRRISGIG